MEVLKLADNKDTGTFSLSSYHMSKFTGGKYVLVQGEKNETEPILIASFYDLFLVTDVDEILILHCDITILTYPSIAMINMCDSYYVQNTFLHSNKLIIRG
jgi:transketolase